MRLLLSLFCFLFCFHLLANEHEEPKTEEHGSSHGQGKAEDNLPEWLIAENQLSTLDSKIISKKSNIERLIEEKNHMGPNDSRLKELLKEIIQEYKELRLAAEEYEKQKTLLKYRFPEKGAGKVRQYKKIEIKSIEEMEANMGIDGRLKRTVNKARSQYDSENKKKKLESPHHDDKSNNLEKSVDQEGTIILQK